MPLWDMYCDTCKTTKEMLFKSSENTETQICETCGNLLERKISSGAFTIKGFNYKNGYSKN